jgi:hypothetical protein
MTRIVRPVSLFVWFSVLSSSLFACSSNDAVAGPPRGPVDLRIAEVQSLSGAVSPSDESHFLTLDCSEPLLVSIAPGNPSDPVGTAPDAVTSVLGGFTLAPPGGCAGVTNCGWIVLTAAIVPTDPAVGALELPPVEAVQSPVRFDLPSSMRNGTLMLHVELKDSTASTVLTENNKPLFNDFELELSAACASP